jgi:homoserine dehydrogenase
MSEPALRTAVLGAGTVGREVVRGIVEHADRLTATDGRPVELAGIAVRDLDRARVSGVPEGLLTDAPAHLVAAPDTDLIVELMGGDEPAHTLVAAALLAGKSVVTANKHVIAHHGPELETLARRTGAALRFEAAVGGGIPILSPIATDLAVNELVRVRGIVNGTTNYILTEMSQQGRSYGEVLADAQALGYAEADPSGDVEGEDAVNKIVILARLAFGVWLDPDSVIRRPPTARGTGLPGITGITDDEVEGAEALGLTIKLLASASRGRPGDRIVAWVQPTAVPSNSPFGWTDGVTNRIEVEGQPIGLVRFAGPGAGGGPTSSAVLADILAIARGGTSTWEGLAAADAGPAGTGSVAADPGHDEPRRWYAYVPPVLTDSLPTALDEAAACEFESGIAIRSERVTLDEARAAFSAILPPGVDATLYPVDE